MKNGLHVVVAGRFGITFYTFNCALWDVAFRTARAKGLREKTVIYSHAFRNALIPIVTLVVGWFLGIFGGSVVIEDMFALNGMGSLMLRSLRTADFDVVILLQLFYVAISLFGNLLIDIIYGLVDPRIRVNK